VDPWERNVKKRPCDYDLFKIFNDTLSIKRVICLSYQYENQSFLLFDIVIKNEGREVQRALNQKVGSKPSKALDVALRFIFLINSKCKILTFNNYYKSRCKINGFREL
jgi:hypothetical protein